MMLNPDHREYAVMRKQGYSWRQIGDKFGCHRHTAKRRAENYAWEYLQPKTYTQRPLTERERFHLAAAMIKAKVFVDHDYPEGQGAAIVDACLPPFVSIGGPIDEHKS
jgi:hypothetical protein